MHEHFTVNMFANQTSKLQNKMPGCLGYKRKLDWTNGHLQKAVKVLCGSIILKIKSVNIILITVRTNLRNNESQIYINSNINRCIINNIISSYI